MATSSSLLSPEQTAYRGKERKNPEGKGEKIDICRQTRERRRPVGKGQKSAGKSPHETRLESSYY